MSRLKKLIDSKFILFVIFSSISAIFNLASRIFFNLLFSYALSVILAQCVGIVIAFLLNTMFVFNSKGEHSIKFIKFISVNMESMLQTLGVALLFREVLFPAMEFKYNPDFFAHLVALASTAATSYFLHKMFTFKERD